MTDQPRRPGRPEVGGRVTVALGKDRVARVKAAARLAGVGFPEMLRRCVDAALTGQPITTPTQPGGRH